MPGSPHLRFAFFVQGEGRGHLTQALSLERMLIDAGHEVVATFVGHAPERPLPGFFRNRLTSPMHTYPAPGFVLDRKARGVRPNISVLRGFARAPLYWANGAEIHNRVLQAAPDLLISFYDLLGGLYTTLFKPGIPLVGIGHHFLFFHPEFPLPAGRHLELLGARVHTLATAPGAVLRLALSFTPLPDLPEKRIKVVPPILRAAVMGKTPVRGDHILLYLLNPGYAEEVDRWHLDHPDVRVHCFWDREDVRETVSPRPGLTFHRLDDVAFLELMATCRGFGSTAGFESVCEAAFLDKPILLVPTGNHIEQLSNALDASRARLAIWQNHFDLDPLLPSAQDEASGQREEFRRWVRAAPEYILPLLEEAGRGKGRR